MGFDVPSSLPGLSPQLQPPNRIRGDSMDSLLLRDRFLFATRRRLIFTGGPFTTTSPTYVTPYLVPIRTSPISTGNLWVIISGEYIDVKVEEIIFGGPTVVPTVNTGPFGCDAQLMTGLPAGSLCALAVNIQTNDISGTLHSIYIVEEILAGSDLP